MSKNHNAIDGSGGQTEKSNGKRRLQAAKSDRTATVSLNAEQQEQLKSLGKWTRMALGEKRRRSDQCLIQDAFDYGLERLLEINETDAQY